MIQIRNNTLDPNDIINSYPSGSIEADTLNKLSSSKKTYKYTSLDQLKFELNLRNNIIKSARDLNRSGMKFRIFKEAMCNSDYWELTEKGGFKLKDNVKPSEGIHDIFLNGPKYGTECSTSIIIIYYKALLNMYPEELFNKTFPALHLRNWQYIDDDLDIYSFDDEENHFPGDCRYFENPEVDSEKTEWQGENAIELGDGTYYGHGIGIKNSDNIIKALNKHRKPDATKSSFLGNTIATPNYKHLANVYSAYTSEMRIGYYRNFFAM